MESYYSTVKLLYDCTVVDLFDHIKRYPFGNFTATLRSNESSSKTYVSLFSMTTIFEIRSHNNDSCF